jgi:gliding motility-associated-like protein
VYNRWGQTVYSFKATSGDWDGTLFGQPQPMGTYIYYIRAKCSDYPLEEVIRGNVTIIK